MSAISSRQVSWYDVHLFVKPYVDAGGRFPLVGTAAWRSLPDDHPQKWAAVLDAAQHHALRVETAQEARAEAAKAVAAAADWPKVAQEIRQRSAFRAEHPWARRKGLGA
ncbi:hypothetical protein BST28_08270 [Mycolicibacter kumamotonensis]|uniref:DUF2742 domain-containing protein n=1 Tax=Mycolicibacter kumamotonensis TaxID=354243 RepID=A0A1X0E8V1_9MYCO|nr:DUF2742 domain-containing protein [Mycolicibacter kumamotonensis]ORA80748.1 hypothetical protein BST28_08270 [Mycolicibacter kumamotonensis]